MGYTITWGARGAVKHFFGEVTGNDVMRSVVEIERDARFDRLRYVINDLLAATAFSCSLQDVDEIAAIDLAASRTNANILIAAVATMPEIVAAARLYAESTMNVYPTRVFATLEEAWAWIATTPPAR